MNNLKKLIAEAALLAVGIICGHAESRHSADTLRLSDFGILPDTYENVTPSLQRLVDSCRERSGCVIEFAPGRYDIWPDGAVRKEIYVSNTSSEVEWASKVKTIGIHLYKLKDVTLCGDGVTLIMHGSMTPVAIDSCENITMKGFTIDFERPGGSELTYVAAEPGKVTVRVHRDSRYEIRNGRLQLIGEGWCTNVHHTIKLSPSNGRFQYSHDWTLLESCDVKELSPGLLEFKVPEDFRPEIGATLTIRDRIRREVGMLNINSRNTRLSDMHIRYMHGLGIVSQYSTDVTLERLDCSPDPQSGRVLASSADFTHFSGCRGHIEVRDCRFVGAQDDAVNVHGTNLRVEKVSDGNELTVCFKHHQSYGFMPFFSGDTVAFVNPSTMLRESYVVVESAEMTPGRPREVRLKLRGTLPDDIIAGETCVENMTWTPSVHVSGCYMSRLSTRGILASTPRKVVIENNYFDRMPSTGVLIEADAKDWFESGPVTDMTIRDNVFVGCGYGMDKFGASIVFNPSNTVVGPDNIVHTGVTITDNVFKITPELKVLYAKSTGDLLFRGNTVEGTDRPVFELIGCDDVVIKDNHMPSPEVKTTDCQDVTVR